MKISVMMITYNHDNFIAQAIESVLMQQVNFDYEIVIGEDCSTDNTRHIVIGYQKKYPKKIRLLLPEKNLGMHANSLQTLQACQGQYIAVLEGDDYWTCPHKLQKQVDFLDSHPECVICFHNATVFYENKDKSITSCNHCSENQKEISTIEDLLLVNFIPTVSVMCRRDVVCEIPDWLYELGLGDWPSHILKAQYGNIGYINEVMAAYRIHSGGAWSSKSRDWQLKETIKTLEYLRVHLDLKYEEIINRSISYYSERLACLQVFTLICNWVERYQTAPSDKVALEELRKGRTDIANYWLSITTEQLETSYLGYVGKAHQRLLGSIKDEPLIDNEQVFVDSLLAEISRGFENPKIICYLLASMLYCQATQLPLQYNIAYIPQWLLNDYLKYIFDSPHLFKEVGEADNYYRYMQQCINYLHTSIFTNPDSDVWRTVATEFSQIANFIPLYFNEVNLKDIYVKRAEIIEWVLKLNGYEVDYEFEDRPVPRKKIRLGILADHFLPAAETFASLPVYEYISRDFEVILYSPTSTGHRLEQYCQSCANSFKLLPNNFIDQVNCIRADDLDILFIATNVTAVTNQICLLSLHRLARIQTTSVASAVTTGMRSIDYYISGKLTAPYEDAEQHYQENLLKIDGSAYCFSYGSESNTATIKVARESLDISKEAVVFVSVANQFKITPELSDTWAKIIASTPDSVLMLFPYGSNWTSTYPKKSFLELMITTFSRYGVEKDRLLILDPDPVPNRDDIKEYLKITDVYLDSYPFSGSTSLIEPLEVGLPIVSKKGTTFRSSMGAALLQELDVPDLVADSEESYIKLAIALGTEPELRKQKSAQIKQRMQANPRFLDSRSYSAQMGALFQELFRKHQASTFTDNLKLRETNLIIFPDWSQSEDLLYQDLASVIISLVNHPKKNQMTLLINTGNLSEDEANLFLSEVVMNLLLEDLDVADGVEISLVGQLTASQWEDLLPHIRARLVLENENQEAIAGVKAENIPAYEIDRLSKLTSIST